MDYLLNGIKYIAKYSEWWILAIIVIFFIKVLKDKEEEEYLTIKMIGFYLLGGLSINLNFFASLPIIVPIGIIVYYLFMKNKERKNKHIKEQVVGLGLIMLFVGFVSGLIYEGLEYRDIKIGNYSGKVNNLEKEYETIKEKLSLDDSSMLREFHMIYDKNKNIESISYNFINTSENKIFTAANYFDGNYIVQVTKHKDDDFFYNELYAENYRDIRVEEFMKIISKIKFEKSTMEKGKNIVNYMVSYNASDSRTGSTDKYEDTKYYLIDSYEDVEFRKAKSRELPIEGVKINHSPMEKISQGSTSAVSFDGYLINPMIIGKNLISEDTENLIVENKVDNKTMTLHRDDDYKYELLSNLDFNSWEEIDITQVKNTKPYIILKDENGTIVTIYKDGYGKYEKSDDKAFYSIPEYVMEYLNTKVKYSDTKTNSINI